MVPLSKSNAFLKELREGLIKSLCCLDHSLSVKGEYCLLAVDSYIMPMHLEVSRAISSSKQLIKSSALKMRFSCIVTFLL